MSDSTIEVLLSEQRTFSPPPELAADAIVADASIYESSSRDYLDYWAKEAKRLVWRQGFSQVLDDSLAPHYRWFSDGTLNVTESCLDQHLAHHSDQVAYYFEGEAGDRRVITYRQLHDDVCQFANALSSLGVRKGDRIAIYMGMVPEVVVAMLATARLGAVHSVVFGGFSSGALTDRINDAKAKVLITCDGAFRSGQVVPLKAVADQALANASTIEHVIVLRRTNTKVEMKPGRDIWYDEAIANQPKTCPAVECESEDLLFLLYTSGTTAKPKGIMHTTGGYLTGVTSTFRSVFDIHPKSDIFWCTADAGWITGHSYVVYGPLANGATSVIYEGALNFPDKDRFWQIVERYKVTTLYTAPTAIRTFMKWGRQYPERHDLSSLRLLASVGEPINPEAWMWYRQVIGANRCAVIDTWWQTETGSIMIAPLPGITATKPGSATHPLPGVSASVVDETGTSVGLGHGGYLVLTRPWPSMLRGIYNDEQRFLDTYWNKFSDPNAKNFVYSCGDGAKQDNDGYYWLLGRIDDVMNVSGHRISTLEVESALVDHHEVAEAAVVGQKHDEKGQVIVAFVTLKSSSEKGEHLATELRDHVAMHIGKLARPSAIVFTEDLPKTRSGKIMRRLLQDIANERSLGDTTTLADESVVAEITMRADLARASAKDQD